MNEEKSQKQQCTSPSWDKSKQTSGKRRFIPPIWPAVYVWLLGGVILIFSKLFSS